jgi:hypothetical protein
MKNIKATAAAPIPRNIPNILFLRAERSDIAPSRGASRAMNVNAIVVATLWRKVAVPADRPAAAYEEKKIGNTAVTITVTIAELAQS